MITNAQCNLQVDESPFNKLSEADRVLLEDVIRDHKNDLWKLVAIWDTRGLQLTFRINHSGDDLFDSEEFGIARVEIQNLIKEIGSKIGVNINVLGWHTAMYGGE